VRLKYRLERLQRSIGPESCPGPVIEFVEVPAGQEPPPPPGCRCGGKHPGLIRQIVVVRPATER
jgi:hypothetical protein